MISTDIFWTLLRDMSFSFFIFSVCLVIFVCAALLPETDKKTKDVVADDDKRRSNRGLTIKIPFTARSAFLPYAHIRLVMIGCIGLLAMIDIVGVAMRDRCSVLDVPVGLVSIYVYRLFAMIGGLASIIDFPFYILGPFISSQRVRNIVWIVVFTVEGYVYKALSKLFIFNPSPWLVHESNMRLNLANQWWSS